MVSKSQMLRNIILGFLLVLAPAVTSCGDKGELGDGFPPGIYTGSSPHPENYRGPVLHGYDFINGTLRCSNCHGERLDGGSSGRSCNSCHSGWQTRCSFCHGDDDTNFAPPPSLFGETETSQPEVGAHQEHVVASEIHGAYDCSVCHVKPTSALDGGHIDGDARAEVNFGVFSGATNASYNRENFRCSAVYCHSSGRTVPKYVTVGWTTTLDNGCNGCHGDDNEARDLSGRHEDHADKGIECARCHSLSVDTANRILDPAAHVDGEANVDFASSGTYNESDRTCSSVSCHSGTYRWGD